MRGPWWLLMHVIDARVERHLVRGKGLSVSVTDMHVILLYRDEHIYVCCPRQGSAVDRRPGTPLGVIGGC